MPACARPHMQFLPSKVSHALFKIRIYMPVKNHRGLGVASNFHHIANSAHVEYCSFCEGRPTLSGL